MMRHLLVPTLVLGLLAGSALGGGPVFAATISKIKGKAVLIKADGDSLKIGDTFYALNSAGKKLAIVRISKIRGEKATGVITKGKAQPGMTLQPRAAAGEKVAGKRARGGGGSAPPEPTEVKRSYWGFLLGYGMDTMNAAVVNTANNPVGTAAMSGSGFSGKGLFDYELFPQIWFRGTAGVEQFNVAGTNICGTTNKSGCDAKLMYATLDLVGRYVFMSGNYRPWLGGGVGLLFPASKSTTALKEASIGTTNVMLIAAGLDWQINSRMYVPVSFEYGLLPKSDEVDAHWMTLRAGLAIPF